LSTVFAAFATKVRQENGEDKVFVDENPYMVHDFAILPEVFTHHSAKALINCADFMFNVYRKSD